MGSEPPLALTAMSPDGGDRCRPRRHGHKQQNPARPEADARARHDLRLGKGLAKRRDAARIVFEEPRWKDQQLKVVERFESLGQAGLTRLAEDENAQPVVALQRRQVLHLLGGLEFD
jgi:hypothetical protein